VQIDEIRELADLMAEKGISLLEVQEGDKKIRIDRGAVSVGVPTASEPLHSAKPETPQNGEVSGKPVKSPMVGVFYAAPSPEEKPFVSVGDKVKKGDVLCIIEAMKLMNEIVADEDGEIAKICVSDGQVVEYGQCLFLIH
jgi:acetyl-CoA carboxylase biotin carboxyl carrier protein